MAYGRSGGHEVVMQMMEGEDPNTEDAGDARHWQDLYTRLSAFTLRRIDQEADGTAVELEQRLAGYRERVAFWGDRAWHLENIVVDEDRRSVTHWSGAILLTRREFQILRLLLEQPGRSFTARGLLLNAWHDTALPEEAVRSYITRIRRKLEAIDFAEIVTDPRDGYRLVLRSTGGESAPGPVAVGSRARRQRTVGRALREPARLATRATA